MPKSPLTDPNKLSLPDLWIELSRLGTVQRMIELAHDEDLAQTGDVTAQVINGGSDGGELVAELVVREAGVVCGLVLGPMVCEVFGGGARFEPTACDGDTVEGGSVVGRLIGEAAAVVTIERTLLNLVGRLSGVATRTAEFVCEIEGTGSQILDTRKTTPGLRVPEKYAVRCGGGFCHRLGLHDAVLIKDNHVAGLGLDGFADRIRGTAQRGAAKRDAGEIRFVQVEVDTLDQLDRVLAIEAGLIDLVLLDNFTIELLAEAVRKRSVMGSKVVLESSGGVTLETVRLIARTGVERISVGGLTHHAVSLDVGLDVRA